MASDELYPIPEAVSAGAHISGMHNYLSTWEKSVDQVEEFWGQQAKERLDWMIPPKTVMRGSLLANLWPISAKSLANFWPIWPISGKSLANLWPISDNLLSNMGTTAS